MESSVMNSSVMESYELYIEFKVLILTPALSDVN